MKKVSENYVDLNNFRTWLHLDIDALTWQGKFTDEFESFWQILFNNNSSQEILYRIDEVLNITESGPLSSWFLWVRNNFISFIFINSSIDINELSYLTKMNLSEVSLILRNFFLSKYPHLDNYFSATLLISDITNPNKNLTFNKICNQINISEEIDGMASDEIMCSFEVTLYDEWFLLLNRFTAIYIKNNIKVKNRPKNSLFKSFLKTIRDIIFIITIILLSLYGIKQLNLLYENNISKSIRINEPFFLTFDKNLKFKSLLDDKELILLKNDIEKLDKVDSAPEIYIAENIDKEFETESEVILTSWDTLPKDFSTADLELSNYEETKKGGFRDNRYGHKKVFRMMLKSADTIMTKLALNKLIKKYTVEKSDNVVPGTEVPGGVYYNLYVPRKYIKEFLAQVSDLGESMLYESKTRGRNPKGKNKVLVWIKNL
ncbi:MAG: hypothetical protein HOJ35_07755 [Bdellovibrionales bacterium]|nr:hypothetical protein [Bdellovibrionales bacterium]